MVSCRSPLTLAADSIEMFGLLGGPFRTKLGTGFCVFPGRGRARTVCKVILLEKADLHAADMERESPDPVELLHNQDPKRTRRVYSGAGIRCAGISLISESPVQSAGGCRRDRSYTSLLPHTVRYPERGGCTCNLWREARRETSLCP